MAAQVSCVQLADELCLLPGLQPTPTKNNNTTIAAAGSRGGSSSSSKLRVPLVRVTDAPSAIPPRPIPNPPPPTKSNTTPHTHTPNQSATDLSELRWETRQAVLLALLAEVPGSPAAPALQQLVAQRRAARRAEKELERCATRPEELGLLPEYVRREEDGFRRRFMAVVGEELARQGPPKPLLAATADPARLVADRGLCLRVIDFLAARHRSRARTLAGLQQRILASSPAPPSPIAAAEGGRCSSRKPKAKPRDDTTGAGERVATPLQPQRPPSPLVLEPATSSSALRSADRRRRTRGSHAKTPGGAAAAAVAELSSPLLRQGMRRLSLQGAAPLWSREGAEEKGRDALGMVKEAVAAARSEQRRSSSSKTPASKLLDDCGLGEVARALHSEEALHVQQAKPRKSTNGGGSAVKGKGDGKAQQGGGMGLAEMLPPVRRPKWKSEKNELVREPPARAAVPAAAAAVSEGEEADEELRVENARLRAELQGVTALYEALMQGGGGGGSGGNGGVDTRVLAVVQQQNAMLAREATALRGEVEGYRDLAEGATALLGGLEACLQELLAHAQQGGGEGNEESGGGSGGNRRRRRSGARASSSAAAAASAEFWAAALAEARQLHGRWRSAKRASRAKHQHGLLLPRDARVFLRRPAERAGVGGAAEEEEDGPAAPVPLSGEWEDRARLRGQGAGDDVGGGQGLLDMERIRGLGGRLAGLVAALEQALEQAQRPGLGADNARHLLSPLLDQARALQLQLAQLGLASTAAGAAGVKGVTGARALLEAFDGLLVPRLRPQELKARVEGLRRLVMAERGALARGMATAVEEAVGLRRVRGAAAGRGGREEAEEVDGGMEEEEEEGSYVEEETEEAPVLDRRYSNGNSNGDGARRAMPSGVRPQWV